MIKELAPTPSQIGTYFDTLQATLSNVPELQPGLNFATNHPESAANIYTDYVALISYLSTLSSKERQAIRDAKKRMVNTHGNFGTASEVSADDLLAELGSSTGSLESLAAGLTNSSSLYFKSALDELVKRMQGGHQLKLSGKQPNDDDPESRKVIWGHTIITDPKALVHFMVSHFMERYFAVALTEQGSQLARQKDFLLNALIDVVLIDHVSSGKFASIYDIWSAPKEQGGLGWVTKDRLVSYRPVA